MHLTGIELLPWLIGSVSALIIGISKTGVPGIGILAVPFLANAYGGQQSIGIMLPMLIVGDCFAVAWYYKSTKWNVLWKLYPWIIPGLIAGGYALYYLNQINGKTDIFSKIIGIFVLLMMFIHLMSKKLGSKVTPTSSFGVALTGSSAGFATVVSNAAGSIMQIYLQALKISKDDFMGTISMYFFTINLVKIPILMLLTKLIPKTPMISQRGLLIDLTYIPIIVLGVYIGKWMLPRIPEKSFNNIILILAGAAAIKLILT